MNNICGYNQYICGHKIKLFAMGRNKGSANKTYFNNKGVMKTKLIRVRVSADWIKTFDEVSNKASFINYMSKSRKIRYLLMRGLLNYCHPSDIDRVNSVLEKT